MGGWVVRRGGWVVRRGDWVVRRGGWVVRRGGWVVRRDGWVVRRGGWVVRRGGWVVRRGGWVVRRGGWVVRRGGWVVRRGGWVVRRGGWVVRRGGYACTYSTVHFAKSIEASISIYVHSRYRKCTIYNQSGTHWVLPVSLHLCAHHSQSVSSRAQIRCSGCVIFLPSKASLPPGTCVYFTFFRCNS